MKKYKMIHRRLYDDQAIIEMLDRESEKGWNMDHVGMMFFRFQSSEQRKYYYIDYAYEDHRRQSQLEEKGYTYIGSVRKANFYCSNTPLPAIQADESEKRELLLKDYPIWGIVLMFALPFMYYANARLRPVGLTMFDFLTRPSEVLTHVMMLVICVYWGVTAVQSILIRKRIQTEKEKNAGRDRWINLLEVILKVFLAAVLILIVLSLGFDRNTNTALLFWIVMIAGIALLCALLYQKFFSGKEDLKIRLLGVVLMVVIYVVMFAWFGRIRTKDILNQKISITPSSQEMYRVDAQDTPWLYMAYFVDVPEEEIYIQTKVKEDFIIKEFQKRIIAWKESGTNERFYWAEIYNKIPIQLIQKADPAKFIETDEIENVDHAWKYEDFYIIRKGNEIVISKASKDIQKVVKHYFQNS